MKVHVLKRGIVDPNYESKRRSEYNLQVHYCGYLEVDNLYNIDLWHLCNWSCWTNDKPKECENLWITHCNSDVVFTINNEYYSHNMFRFNNFKECYSHMINSSITNPYFRAIFPIDEGLYNDKIIIVNPSNIEEVINNYQ